jgi:hypothetical protein
MLGDHNVDGPMEEMHREAGVQVVVPLKTPPVAMVIGPEELVAEGTSEI